MDGTTAADRGVAGDVAPEVVEQVTVAEVVEEVVVEEVGTPVAIIDETDLIGVYNEEEMKGVEYTGRTTVDYADIYILYKVEVELESLRIDQPTPKVPYYHKIP